MMDKLQFICSVGLTIFLAIAVTNKLKELEDKVSDIYSSVYRLEQQHNERLKTIESTFDHLPISDDLKHHIREVHGVK